MSEQPITAGESPRLPDLASRRLGGSVIAANDEFFAERENLIKAADPVYRPHTFTNKGQEYDGWETRRRRGEPGDHDWAVIRLGVPGIPRTIIVDTAFFAGNYPPFVAVEGCGLAGYSSVETVLDADWEPIVPRSPIAGDTQNVFTVDGGRCYTHVRLRIFPDGGVARLRVHGVVVPDPRWLADLPFDLAALAHGGDVVGCSDWFFSPPSNMLQPGASLFMADGWETARRRDTGHDWAVVRLAGAAIPRVIEVDTTHYKGNSPERVAVAGADARVADLDAPESWTTVLPETRLQPDAAHRFRVAPAAEVTHLRLAVLPDGGIGRFRVYGALADTARSDLAARWFAALPTTQALAVLAAAGCPPERAHDLAAHRPEAGQPLPPDLARLLNQ